MVYVYENAWTEACVFLNVTIMSIISQFEN